MRLFLAVNLEPGVQGRVYQDATALRAVAPDIGWVLPPRMHVTVKFLGEVGAPMVSPLVTAVATAAQGHAAFTLELGGVGAFPDFRHPRVVWLGAPEAQPLAALARAVEDVCAALSMPREERAFHAHLTLGRVRRPLPRATMAALEAAARGLRGRYSVPVSSIDLMRSELSPQGPRYAVVAALPLRSG